MVLPRSPIQPKVTENIKNTPFDLYKSSGEVFFESDQKENIPSQQTQEVKQDTDNFNNKRIEINTPFITKISDLVAEKMNKKKRKNETLTLVNDNIKKKFIIDEVFFVFLIF